MKKTYQQPTTSTYNVTPQTIINGSGSPTPSPNMYNGTGDGLDLAAKSLFRGSEW